MKKLLKASVGALAVSAMVTTTAIAGGILKRGNGAEPATLDPHFASGTWENNIIGDMFLGLTTEDSKGVMIPGLATSWKISEDGKTYTFKIRDAVWSDGTEITADDFVFSFKRILAPETAAKYSFMLHPIKGAKAFNEGKGKASDVAVKAIDKDTLEVKLEKVTPYFLESLTHYTGWAVPAHTVKKHGKEWARKGNIVVSGAFTLKEWTPNSKVVLTKNKKFFDAKNVSLDGVEFYPVEKATAELKRWKAGEFHTTTELPGGMLSNLKKEFGSQVLVSPRLGTYYYTINHNVFKDVRVRQALNMSINREIITSKISGNGEVPAYSWVAPKTNNYPSAARLSFEKMSYADRVKKAKDLMAAAGYSKSKPLEVALSYNTSEGHKKVAVAIASMWKQVGVKVTLSNSEAKVHYAELKKNNFEIGRAGWIGDYNDPTTFLDLFLADVTYNYGRYNNSKFDALMKKAAGMASDLNARAAILKQAEKLAIEEVALMPIYHYVNKQMVSNKITGWDSNLIGTHRSRWVSFK